MDLSDRGSGPCLRLFNCPFLSSGASSLATKDHRDITRPITWRGGR
jgi:hypothetical protein